MAFVPDAGEPFLSAVGVSNNCAPYGRPVGCYGTDTDFLFALAARKQSFTIGIPPHQPKRI